MEREIDPAKGLHPLDGTQHYKDYHPRYGPLWSRLVWALFAGIMMASFAAAAGVERSGLLAVFVGVGIAVFIARST